MRTSNAYVSPNFTAEIVPVRFVVLHYTATDLAGTMDIFTDPKRGTCAHFVLDRDGTVYDLGKFLDGPIRRGAHAGESRVEIDGVTYASLNQMSIGIEIINFNGNLFDYTDAQYAGLTALVGHLITRFPELREPARVLGHEQIAGYRGKCDPGVRFDWPRLLNGLGLKPHALHACHACTPEDLTYLEVLTEQEMNPTPDFWARLSSQIEARIKDHRPAECRRTD